MNFFDAHLHPFADVALHLYIFAHNWNSLSKHQVLSSDIISKLRCSFHWRISNEIADFPASLCGIAGVAAVDVSIDDKEAMMQLVQGRNCSMECQNSEAA